MSARSLSIQRKQPRLFGFDALRAGASILVVMLHAAHAYIPNQMPGLVWPAHDSQPSVFVDGLFWWIEGFIMPLFLWMSGFFAAGILVRKGATRFLRNRVDRILKPLAFACLVILPIDFYAWAIGFVLDGRAPLRKLRSLKFDPEIQDKLWGLSHLWYLQYVFLFCLGLWCIARLMDRGAFQRSAMWFGRYAKDAVAIAVLALVPCVAVLHWSPETVIGFQHSFFPVPAKFVWSGAFFFGGALMYSLRDTVDRLCDLGPWLLAGSIPAAFLMVTLTHRYFTDGLSSTDTLAYASATSAFAWLTVLGLAGCSLRFFHSEHAAVSYVAEASFWTYLLHHPVVGLLQGLFGLTTLAAGLKFCLVTAITIAVTLGSWKLIRSTRIGHMLGGQRRSPDTPVTGVTPNLRRAA